jgi:hypothetical protein
MRLNQRQREILAEKLIDLANIVAGALVIGQVVSDKFDTISFIFGLLVTGVLYLVGLEFSKQRPATTL